VKAAANRAGIKNLAPHDLRRTCARLTTEGYLGCKQKLSHAVNDNLGLEDT
jgi:integrase